MKPGNPGCSTEQLDITSPRQDKSEQEARDANGHASSQADTAGMRTNRSTKEKTSRNDS